MDNEDTGRHALAVSWQTGIPRTRPTFGHPAPILADFGHELSRDPAAHRNVALANHAGAGSATALPDRFSRGRRGWRVRSPPKASAAGSRDTCGLVTSRNLGRHIRVGAPVLAK